eukprot:m.17283 g.17283  ORF g.17283 m.17283 type:complete len:87 (+) comp5428_c0_seq1:153-413(+)
MFRLETHVDFQGQQLAEHLYQYIILGFSIVGFVWGYLCNQLDQTVYVIGAGVLLASFLVLPPWPFYRRQPLPWLRDGARPPTKPTG